MLLNSSAVNQMHQQSSSLDEIFTCICFIRSVVMISKYFSRIAKEVNFSKCNQFIIIIIWFGDTVTVTHPTNCNTNSKVRACQLNIPTTPFPAGAFHLTQPHPHARKRKHGRSLTVMPWTTTDEFNVVPKTQRMSLASFPGQVYCIIQLKS